MNINLNSNVGLSAKWNLEVCTPTNTGVISEFPYGTGFRNNAILNYFLSGIVIHLHKADPPQYFAPSYFTDGYIQIGTGIKPITYHDSSLHKFYTETNFIRPFASRINIDYLANSGLTIFEKTYDFAPVPGVVKFTEAGFRHVGASTTWAGRGVNPIYSRFLFAAETPFTGYISGVLNDNGTFTVFDHPFDQKSGVFAISDGKSGIEVKNYEINSNIVTKELITGFWSGFREFLGPFSGFYTNGASGYYLSGQKYFFPPYDVLSGENVNGYISGNMTEGTGFVPYTSQEQASSGYFLNNIRYEFTGDFNEFNGLSGFENGYTYYGYDFLYGSGFVSEIPGEIYGNGKITGIIGVRNIKISSGKFVGFDSSEGFDKTVGYLFSGFFMTGHGSGFVGNLNNFGTGVMTGIIGYRNTFFKNTSGLDAIPTHEYGWYITKSGLFGESGVSISGNTYSGLYPEATGFSGMKYATTELINGFISGQMNQFGTFQPLTQLDNISGYTYNNQTYYFPTGSNFNGFNDNIVFSGKLATYSGFFIDNINYVFSGIGGLTTGSGILTGYIGSVKTEHVSNITGILTGIGGYKKYISGVTLDRGQYIKITYQIAYRIPQYVSPSYITGDSVLYGDFNGSGQLKLLGPKQKIFGQLYVNDVNPSRNGTTIMSTANTEGVWWPASLFTKHASFPNIALSAVMLRWDESLQYTPLFPDIDTRPALVSVTGLPEEKNDGVTYAEEDWAPYPSKKHNTLYSTFTGGYELSNLFVFPGNFPNFDVDIGGIWFSYKTFTEAFRNPNRYIKPASGNCGWLYKFDTPQRKWEDQSIYIETKLTLERDQYFEDPYYGRYPQ